MLGRDDFQSMGILLRNNQWYFKKHTTLNLFQTYLLIAFAYIVVKFLECCIYILDREDALEEDITTHSSILAWRIPRDGGAWLVTVLGVTKSQTRLND